MRQTVSVVLLIDFLKQILNLHIFAFFYVIYLKKVSPHNKTQGFLFFYFIHFYYHHPLLSLHSCSHSILSYSIRTNLVTKTLISIYVSKFNCFKLMHQSTFFFSKQRALDKLCSLFFLLFTNYKCQKTL